MSQAKTTSRASPKKRSITLEELREYTLVLPPGFETLGMSVVVIWSPGSKTPILGLVEQAPKVSSIDDVNRLFAVNRMVKGPEAVAKKAKANDLTVGALLRYGQGKNVAPHPSFKAEVLKANSLNKTVQKNRKLIDSNINQHSSHGKVKAYLAQKCTDIVNALDAHLDALASGNPSKLKDKTLEKKIPKYLVSRLTGPIQITPQQPLYRILFPAKTGNGLKLTIEEWLAGYGEEIDRLFPTQNLQNRLMSSKNLIHQLTGVQENELVAETTNTKARTVLDHSVLVVNLLDPIEAFKDFKKSPPARRAVAPTLQIVEALTHAIYGLAYGILPPTVNPETFWANYKVVVDAKLPLDVRAQIEDKLDKDQAVREAIGKIPTVFPSMFTGTYRQFIAGSSSAMKAISALLCVVIKDDQDKNVTVTDPVLMKAQDVPAGALVAQADISDKLSTELTTAESALAESKKLILKSATGEVRRKERTPVNVLTILTPEGELAVKQANKHGHDFGLSLKNYLQTFAAPVMQRAAAMRILALLESATTLDVDYERDEEGSDFESESGAEG